MAYMYTAVAAAICEAAAAFNQKRDLWLSWVWTTTACDIRCVIRLRLEAVANQLCGVTAPSDVSDSAETLHRPPASSQRRPTSADRQSL